MPAGAERLLAADGRFFPRPGGSLGWPRSGKLPSYCSHALAGGAATSQFRRRLPFPSNAAELGEFLQLYEMLGACKRRAKLTRPAEAFSPRSASWSPELARSPSAWPAVLKVLPEKTHGFIFDFMLCFYYTLAGGPHAANQASGLTVPSYSLVIILL